MTAKDRSYDEELGRLADALVDDLFDTPDAVFTEEVTEEGARKARAAFEVARAEVGKNRLRAAKAVVGARTKTEPLPQRFMTVAQKRETVRQVLERSRGQLSQEVTLAARNNTEQTESELDATIEAFVRLGLIGDEGELE